MLLVGTLLRLGAVVVMAVAIVKVVLPQILKKLARLGMLVLKIIQTLVELSIDYD